MEGVAGLVDFGQKTGVGVCGGVFGLWWVCGCDVGRSRKVEFR